MYSGREPFRRGAGRQLFVLSHLLGVERALQVFLSSYARCEALTGCGKKNRVANMPTAPRHLETGRLKSHPESSDSHCQFRRPNRSKGWSERRGRARSAEQRPGTHSSKERLHSIRSSPANWRSINSFKRTHCTRSNMLTVHALRSDETRSESLLTDQAASKPLGTLGLGTRALRRNKGLECTEVRCSRVRERKRRWPTELMFLLCT